MMWVVPFPFLLLLLLEITPTFPTMLEDRHKEDSFSLSPSERSSSEYTNPFDLFRSQKVENVSPKPAFPLHLLQEHFAESHRVPLVSANHSQVVVESQLFPNTKEEPEAQSSWKENSLLHWKESSPSIVDWIVTSSRDSELESFSSVSKRLPLRGERVKQRDRLVLFSKEQIPLSKPPQILSRKAEPNSAAITTTTFHEEVERENPIAQSSFENWKIDDIRFSNIYSRLAVLFGPANLGRFSRFFFPITTHPRWNVSFKDDPIHSISFPFLSSSAKILQGKEEQNRPQSSVKAQPIDGSVSHRHRGVRSIDKGCHSQHLQKCGSNVIQEFSLGVTSSSSKCKIREEFLDCMVQQREKECVSTEEVIISAHDTESIRTEVKNLLWSAKGCLLF